MPRFYLFIIVACFSYVIHGDASTTSTTLNVPFDTLNGASICSPFAVSSFQYTASAPSPGLLAVYACSQPTRDILIKTDPANVDSPENPSNRPFMEMSCTQTPITVCIRQWSDRFKFKSQVMCILLKASPANKTATASTLPAKIEVTWDKAIGDASENGTSSFPTLAVVLSLVAAMILIPGVIGVYMVRRKQAKAKRENRRRTPEGIPLSFLNSNGSQSQQGESQLVTHSEADMSPPPEYATMTDAEGSTRPASMAQRIRESIQFGRGNARPIRQPSGPPVIHVDQCE